LKGENIEVGFDRKVIVTRFLLDELKASDICKMDYLKWAEKIIIFHGTQDEVVPYNTDKAFAEKNRIKFVPVAGADHRFQNPDHMNLANQATMEFFGFE